MASLGDYSNLSGNSPQFAIAEMGIKAGEVTADAGLAKQRMGHVFRNETLPQLVNSFASKGTFYGGSAGVAAKNATWHHKQNMGDVELGMRRTIADLTRQRLYASLGVSA